MKPVLLSTAYFPPVSWMAVALQSENTGIEIHETYPKQTFRNRCVIATSSGTSGLTVPVIRINGNHTQTCDIAIDNSKSWQLQHWRSIITSYNKTPYFLFYRDHFEPLYYKKHERLIDLNQELLAVLIQAFQIDTFKIYYTSQYDFNPECYDFRNSFQPTSKSHEGFTINLPRYIQAFEMRHGFLNDLSIIDLLFNLGPDALTYLKTADISFPY